MTDKNAWADDLNEGPRERIRGFGDAAYEKAQENSDRIIINHEDDGDDNAP